MKTKKELSRRHFISKTSALGLAVVGTGVMESSLVMGQASATSKPVILGGAPISIKTKTKLSWPQLQGQEEEKILSVLKSGNWCRMGAGNGMDVQFEAAYAKMCGAKHCIATNSGTSALVASLAAQEIGPGDEVIVSPYTFIASVNCILDHYGLPVFVDSDPETFQLNSQKVEAAFTANTRACIPVHIGGAPADLGTILPLAAKRNIPVIEDACQAHLGEWNGKKLGSLGTSGCFSFQVSKNLCCGDGGAILTNNDKLAEKLFACHNNSRGKVSSLDFTYGSFRASNLRMSEFQGAVLCAQIKNIEKNQKIRNENALYLSSLLKDIPGVKILRIYPGGTSAWHIYMFRIEEKEFGLSRDKFLDAMNKENIFWVSAGYSAMDWVGYVRNVYNSRAGKKIYPEKVLKDWSERTILTENVKLCSQAVWFGQTELLYPRIYMDAFADAVRRIQKNAAAIAKL